MIYMIELKDVPESVRKILKEYEEKENTYENCKELSNKLVPLGWDIDYDLHANINGLTELKYYPENEDKGYTYEDVKEETELFFTDNGFEPTEKQLEDITVHTWMSLYDDPYGGWVVPCTRLDEMMQFGLLDHIKQN